MKTLLTSGLALVLACSTHAASAQTDQIVGGYTTITFNAQLLGLADSVGLNVTDLGGNVLKNGVNVLPTVQGVIDLQTGATNVTFKGGYQITIPGLTVRVEDLILHASETASGITGVVIENGHVLGRREIFNVNQNPDLILPLKPVDQILKLPTLSLGVSSEFIPELNKLAGKPVLNPGVQVATASPLTIVTPDAPTLQ